MNEIINRIKQLKAEIFYLEMADASYDYAAVAAREKELKELETLLGGSND